MNCPRYSFGLIHPTLGIYKTQWIKNFVAAGPSQLSSVRCLGTSIFSRSWTVRGWSQVRALVHLLLNKRYIIKGVGCRGWGWIERLNVSWAESLQHTLHSFKKRAESYRWFSGITAALFNYRNHFSMLGKSNLSPELSTFLPRPSCSNSTGNPDSL